jgi:hypothetical protein
MRMMRTPCRISSKDILNHFLQDILQDIPSAAQQLPANFDWVPAAALWLCILPTGPVFALDSVL